MRSKRVQIDLSGFSQKVLLPHIYEFFGMATNCRFRWFRAVIFGKFQSNFAFQFGLHAIIQHISYSRYLTTHYLGLEPRKNRTVVEFFPSRSRPASFCSAARSLDQIWVFTLDDPFNIFAVEPNPGDDHAAAKLRFYFFSEYAVYPNG